MRRVRFFVLFLSVAAGVGFTSAGMAAEVVLGALDKVTARVSSLIVPVQGMAEFGTLEVMALSCHKRPPEEPPETAAFLKIYDRSLGRNESFKGWMFASSPAVHALEHPVYDVWVLDCR